MITYRLDSETSAVGIAHNRSVLTANFTIKRHVLKDVVFIAQFQRNATVNHILECHTLIYGHLSHNVPGIFVRRGTVDGFDGLEGHG